MNLARAANPGSGPARPVHVIRRILFLGLLLTVTACGGGASAAAPPPDPAALVGWWQVAGTGQRVLVDATALEVTDGELTYAGTWRADPAGRFVAGLDSWGPDADGAAPVPQWVSAAAAFRLDGTAVVLLDRSGAEVVRLEPADPSAGSGLVDPGRPGPLPDARPAAALPAGLSPAGPDELAGRWSAGAAGVEFLPEGTWTGSDGCNGTGGSWTADSGGGLLATAASVSTLIACDGGGTDVGSALAVARVAGLDGEELVLLDADGAEQLRLRRS